MKVPPYVNDATGLKKTPKGGRALTRRVRRVRTEAINRAVKDHVKIAGKNSGHRGINLGMKIIQELIPNRVAIRTINTANTKRLTKKGKFTLDKTTINITPRINQR